MLHLAGAAFLHGAGGVDGEGKRASQLAYDQAYQNPTSHTGHFNDRQSFADFWVLKEKFQRSLTGGVARPTFGETSTIVEIDMSQITRSIRAASDLGASIRERRKTLSMTQGDLAMQAGVSVATISAIENGKDTAQIGIVLDLCQDLGLRLSVET